LAKSAIKSKNSHHFVNTEQTLTEREKVAVGVLRRGTICQIQDLDEDDIVQE
jgi:hypothetical protein